MLARELANCGYRAQLASDPFEALRLAVSEKPDIVLTSAVLDGMPGIDLLRSLRAIRATSRLPVAVVTSFDAGHPELAGLPQDRSEEHTSELQSLMRRSYSVLLLKNK